MPCKTTTPPITQEVNVQLNKRARDMKLHFLTPTLYKIENREGED